LERSLRLLNPRIEERNSHSFEISETSRSDGQPVHYGRCCDQSVPLRAPVGNGKPRATSRYCRVDWQDAAIEPKQNVIVFAGGTPIAVYQ
jgi:hypothetical protein